MSKLPPGAIPKVKTVRDETGCTLKQSKAALECADWNVLKAIRLIHRQRRAAERLSRSPVLMKRYSRSAIA